MYHPSYYGGQPGQIYHPSYYAPPHGMVVQPGQSQYGTAQTSSVANGHSVMHYPYGQPGQLGMLPSHMISHQSYAGYPGGHPGGHLGHPPPHRTPPTSAQIGHPMMGYPPTIFVATAAPDTSAAAAAAA